MVGELRVPYGNGMLFFGLPEEWSLISNLSPQDPDPLRDLSATLAGSLRNPIGCPGIAELASGRKRVAVIIDDKTRPTPADRLIPVVLKELEAAGVKDKDVTVVVGRGLHPKMTESELAAKIGKTVLESVNVADHNADSGFIPLGKTSNNVPISVNSLVAGSDLKIGLGSIFPHELLGFTGGSSIIVPGVASRETINKNHMLVGKFDAEFGRIEGNLIRSDSEEAARKTGLDIIVNVVLNSKDEVINLSVGDVVRAHREGVAVSQKVHGVKIEKLADVTIVSSSPKGTTFGKGLKAIFAADLATKPNGTIIFASPCNEGISSSEVFREMLLTNPGPKFLFKLLKGGELPGESCVLYLFSLVKKRKKIILVSEGVSSTEAEKIGINSANSIEEAIVASGKKKADVYVMPRGSITLPILRR
ncbi:MAG: nickel-dependent lactate racemase [Promethearchaeati archaeon SRVP18_Atabeyarchaeia-1]